MATTKQPVCRKASYHRINSVYGTLELTIEAKVFGYHVEDIKHEFGPAFRAFNLTKYEHQRKQDGQDSYDVLIEVTPADPKQPRHACECLGFLRWHKCKHVSSLLALIESGKL